MKTALLLLLAHSALAKPARLANFPACDGGIAKLAEADRELTALKAQRAQLLDAIANSNPDHCSKERRPPVFRKLMNYSAAMHTTTAKVHGVLNEKTPAATKRADCKIELEEFFPKNEADERALYQKAEQLCR